MALKVIDFVHPDSRQLVADRVQRMLTTGETAPVAEMKLIMLNGAVIDVEVAAAQIVFKGKQSILVVVRDNKT